MIERLLGTVGESLNQSSGSITKKREETEVMLLPSLPAQRTHPHSKKSPAEWNEEHLALFVGKHRQYLFLHTHFTLSVSLHKCDLSIAPVCLCFCFCTIVCLSSLSANRLHLTLICCGNSWCEFGSLPRCGGRKHA